MGKFNKRPRNDEDGETNGKRTRESVTRQPRELAEGEEREVRRPKKKVACLIGYCGTGYHGMQVNPPQKTIEGDLFQAFVRAGAISKDNADDPKKSSFMRAARTDKGVHAAGNVVSLKLIVEDEDIVERINAELPNQIRVWGISRTNKAFECRKMCSSRVYEYLIPSYSFLPPKPLTSMARKMKAIDEETGFVRKEDQEGIAYWLAVRKDIEEQGLLDAYEKAFGEETVEAGLEPGAVSSDTNKESGKEVDQTTKRIRAVENTHRRAYRISAERLERIRKLLVTYKGVHNFHNFTVGKDFQDASSKRNMMDLTVSEGKIIKGTEWLSIKIHGQSFMLHQIRKMVAMVALAVRYDCPHDIITEAFKSTRISVPKAPSLGLLLEKPVYEAYNKRLSTFGHDEISFDKVAATVEKFKMDHIYDKIYAEENQENVFHGFFAFIDSMGNSGAFDYFSSRGVTGKEIVVKEATDELEGDNEG